MPPQASFASSQWRLSLRRRMALLGLLALVCAVSTVQAVPRAAQDEPGLAQLGHLPDTPTDRWAVRLAPGTNPTALAEHLGARNLGPVGTLRGVHVFQFAGVDPQRDAARVATLLRANGSVRWFAQQIMRQLHTRDISDPNYPQQWHLQNTGQSAGPPGEDANVTGAWAAGYTGTGVVIGVVDDGLQYSHPDLAPNYRADVSYDWNGDRIFANDPDNDPDPTINRRIVLGHGTSASGVAAASDDGSTCGVGVAYDAQLAGLRLIAYGGTDAEIADAMTHAYNTISISSNSWGPSDDGKTLEAPGPLTQAALADGTANGRGGKGSIYVWAAGNGLQGNDNANYDGYANSRYTIAVGATGPGGVQAFYSEPGAPILINAPSNGYTGTTDGEYAGIVTTDLLGENGYNNTTPGMSNNCTDNFGGTSSAAPLAAGAVALVLQANPDLTWRDVQHILAQTAVKNDPTDAEWSVNAAGFDINHKYGFGRVDAEAAVYAARSWVGGGPEATPLDSGVLPVGQAIPDNNPVGITQSFNLPTSIRLEHVELVLDAAHTARGDLRVTLTAPSGTQSVLAEPRDDSGNNYPSWTFMTVRNWGEASQGRWTLHITDERSGQTGTLNAWQLRLYGTPLSSAQVSLAPGTSTGAGAAGTSVTHALQLTNLGSATDSFDLSISGASWPTTPSAAQITDLAPGSSTALNIAVAVPPGAPLDAYDNASVTVRSRSDGRAMFVGSLKTTVSRFGVAAAPRSPQLVGNAGANVVHRVEITNTGIQTSTFDLAITATDWPATLNTTTVGPLAPQQTALIEATVSIPATALQGSSATTTVRASSQDAPAQQATATLVTVAATYQPLLAAPDPERVGAAGDTLQYRLTVLNQGTFSDTIDLEVRDNAWPTMVQTPTLTLAPNQSSTALVEVRIPATTADGAYDRAVIVARSRGNSAKTATVTLTSAVGTLGRIYLPLMQ